ncbi:MAG TPA: DNA/RNA helicase domain-containing protein [Thermoplasmataceae archaeon]|nr:DNA/RNA helicase domain-containing protein [Thermoplasmataceae archaeon]
MFFVDDRQVIRPQEVGSTQYIEEHARNNGCNVYTYELETQFRCKGSDAFVNWINNTLGIERNANVMWTGEEDFDFSIMESPEAVEEAIREKLEEGKKGRMVAGFCWPWSNPREDGTLVDDVVIGDYKRPWNAKPGSKKLAKGIPVSNLWANDPGGMNQVGCVYTAQGFEFDYVGVIFGKDLVYNLDSQSWEGHPDNSWEAKQNKPKDRFTQFVKNTYRVLLSRGIEGCFVYFMDKDTERFFKTRIMRKEDI